MSFSLSAIATALSVVAGAVQASEVIYKAGAELIAVAENAYASSVGSGSTKKAAVLAALAQFCTSIGENWGAIKDEVSSWIDMVVQSWNSLKSLVGSDGAATVATVATDTAESAAVVA